MEIADYTKDSRIKWIINHTSKKSVFLNSSFTYHPASLAGRAIFLGWPYFVWSAGYDAVPRQIKWREIYESQNKEFICKNLLENKIDFFTVENGNFLNESRMINTEYFLNNFNPAFYDKETNFGVFSVSANCNAR